MENLEDEPRDAVEGLSEFAARLKNYQWCDRACETLEAFGGNFASEKVAAIKQVVIEHRALTALANLNNEK